MADVTPSIRLERAKLENQVSQLRHNLNSIELRELTIAVELEQIATNKASALAAIDDLQQRIDALVDPIEKD